MAEVKKETRIINDPPENNPKSDEVVEEIYEAGTILDGKVTGITSFGAFIKLPNGKEGLVHISEIADAYVTNIEQFLKLDQDVKVKVLGKNNKGKYDLSIKQAGENQIKTPETQEIMPHLAPGKKKNIEAGSFDELMDNFMKKSEEIQLDVRRNLQYKQGVKKKGMKKNKPLKK